MVRFAALWVMSTGCGARTDPWVDDPIDVDVTPNSDATDIVPADRSDAIGSDTVDTVDVAMDVPPPPPCILRVIGEPTTVIRFMGPAGNADLAVLDPGTAGTSRTATLAAQGVDLNANVWHPELRVTRLSVPSAATPPVTVDRPVTLFGIDAHGGGQLAPSLGAFGGLSLLYYYGGETVAPTTLRMATFDTAAWSARPFVVVDPDGESSFSLTIGSGVASSQTLFSGSAYGAVWRARVQRPGGPDAGIEAQARFGLLDANGRVLLGPLAVSAPLAYPGRAGDAVWTGSNWLVATSFDACGTMGAPCAVRSVVLQRTRLATAPGARDARLEATATIAAASGLTPRRPVLASYAGATWLVWSEGPMAEADPRVVRMVPVTPDGVAALPSLNVSTSARLTSLITANASELGVLVGWVEAANIDLPPHVPGRSRLVIHHRAGSGAEIQPPVVLPITDSSTFGDVQIVTTANPRAAFVAFTAHGPAADDRDGIQVLRLDCGP